MCCGGAQSLAVAGLADRSCCCWEVGCWLHCEMRLVCKCVGPYLYVLSLVWEGSRNHVAAISSTCIVLSVGINV